MCFVKEVALGKALRENFLLKIHFYRAMIQTDLASLLYFIPGLICRLSLHRETAIFNMDANTRLPTRAQPFFLF